MDIKKLSVKLSEGRTVEFNKLAKVKDLFTFISLNLSNWGENYYYAFCIAAHSDLTTQDVLKLKNNDLTILKLTFQQFALKNFFKKQPNENVFELHQGLRIGGIKYNRFVFDGYADASHQIEFKQLGKMDWVMPLYAITKEISQIGNSNEENTFPIQLHIEDLEEMLLIEEILLESFADYRRGFKFPLDSVESEDDFILGVEIIK